MHSFHGLQTRQSMISKALDNRSKQSLNYGGSRKVWQVYNTLGMQNIRRFRWGCSTEKVRFYASKVFYIFIVTVV